MNPDSITKLIEALEKGGPWAIVSLLIVAVVCLWKARERDNREHYENAISWAEQGAEREAKLNDTIDTLTKAFGG